MGRAPGRAHTNTPSPITATTTTPPHCRTGPPIASKGDPLLRHTGHQVVLLLVPALAAAPLQAVHLLVHRAISQREDLRGGRQSGRVGPGEAGKAGRQAGASDGSRPRMAGVLGRGYG